MTTPQNASSDRRRTLAVAEDAQRIAHLAQELQRNALELEGQSHKLRGTLEALESANEELDRRTSEIASAQAIAWCVEAYRPADLIATPSTPAKVPTA